MAPKRSASPTNPAAPPVQRRKTDKARESAYEVEQDGRQSPIDLKRRREDDDSTSEGNKRVKNTIAESMDHTKEDDVTIDDSTSASTSTSLRKLEDALEAYNKQPTLCNIENANPKFPSGELEYNRTNGARKITWRMHFSPDPTYGKIFFYAHTFKYGGPFGFMSNFHYSPLTLGVKWDKKLRNYAAGFVFSSVEHVYQWAKCICIADLDEVRVAKELPSRPVTSKQIERLVLVAGHRVTPNQVAAIGRMFCQEFGKEDPWNKKWRKRWEWMVEELLSDAIDAKIDQNLELKTLLMMTGNFEIFEASASDDQFGIGFSAYEAMLKGNMRKYGLNVLGRCLVRKRDKVRAAEPGWPTTFAFDFWIAWEKLHPGKNYEPLTKAEERELESRKEKAEAEWIKSGGPEFEELLKDLERIDNVYKTRNEMWLSTWRERYNVPTEEEMQQALQEEMEKLGLEGKTGVQ